VPLSNRLRSVPAAYLPGYLCPAVSPDVPQLEDAACEGIVNTGNVPAQVCKLCLILSSGQIWDLFQSFWIHAPHSSQFFAQSFNMLLTYIAHYTIIEPWKGGNQMGKQKKPPSKLDKLKTIVEILAGLANIVLAIHTILKG
jgi:hypothetical protein